jgi:branched-chain amino acid transport system permease protein
MLLVSAEMLPITWLLLKKTRIGLIIQAALSHPNMVSALGHNVLAVFAGGCALAGLAGVIGAHGPRPYCL